MRPTFESPEGRFNAGPRTYCQRCSARDNLKYAFANGKDIFLCPRHYDEWLAEAERNKEMVRQIPGRQRLGFGENGDLIPAQDRRSF